MRRREAKRNKRIGKDREFRVFCEKFIDRLAERCGVPAEILATKFEPQPNLARYMMKWELERQKYMREVFSNHPPQIDPLKDPS